MNITPKTVSTSEPEGRSRDEYTDGAIIQLVRAVVPKGQTAATYNVLAGAARAAVQMTPARADGLIYPIDVLSVLCAALDATRLAKSSVEQ